MTKNEEQDKLFEDKDAIFKRIKERAVGADLTMIQTMRYIFNKAFAAGMELAFKKANSSMWFTIREHTKKAKEKRMKLLDELQEQLGDYSYYSEAEEERVISLEDSESLISGFRATDKAKEMRKE